MPDPGPVPNKRSYRDENGTYREWQPCYACKGHGYTLEYQAQFVLFYLRKSYEKKTCKKCGGQGGSYERPRVIWTD